MNDDSIEGRKSSWPLVILSIVCAVNCIYLFYLYSDIHNAQDLRCCTRLLGDLEYYRLFGMASLIFAVYAYRREPKWPAIIMVPLCGMALVVSIIIQ